MTRRLTLPGIGAALLLCLPAAVGSQEDSSATRLDPVIVTVTRGSGRSVLASPFALSVVRPDSTRPGQRHAAIDETLSLVPGLSATNRNNPSQDARLSIRGFGARSAFGVRGVRVLRDGIPLTLPDGQTPLDYLSLESVGYVEVMRGSASALYGNASGGVVDIRTALPAASPLSGEIRQWLGSDDYSRSVLAASGRSGGFSYIGDIAHSSSNGNRMHSRQRATAGFARAGFSSARGSYALTLLALDNPLSQNPGAVTLAEMRDDPRTADPLSVRRRASKAVNQLQIGASAERPIGRGDLTAYGYGGSRSLDNPLTFAVVEIGRHSYGGGLSVRRPASLAGMRHRFATGADFQTQNDLRRNYAQCADTIPPSAPTTTCPDISSARGIVTLDQRELVSSVGLYVTDEIELSSRLTVTAGARADQVRFEVRDRLVSDANPDDSGERTLSSVSPIAGAVMRVTRLSSVYGNISSAFETPTATELGNQPDGTAGINPDLNAQKSLTLEVGWKGYAGSAIGYDIALFSTRVRDELVPFEIPGSNGRRYFRNAGRTIRHGAEAGVTAAYGSVSMMMAYSYSRFRFKEFVAGTSDFSGNFIPGLPRHRAQGAVTFSGSRGFAGVETELAGSSFVDDANSLSAPGYSVFHLRAGLKPLRSNPHLTVTAGAQNILNRSYASSIAVNAARERFFEPAAQRSFFVGLAFGVQVRAAPAAAHATGTQAPLLSR